MARTLIGTLLLVIAAGAIDPLGACGDKYLNLGLWDPLPLVGQRAARRCDSDLRNPQLRAVETAGVPLG